MGKGNKTNKMTTECNVLLNLILCAIRRQRVSSTLRQTLGNSWNNTCKCMKNEPLLLSITWPLPNWWPLNLSILFDYLLLCDANFRYSNLFHELEAESLHLKLLQVMCGGIISLPLYILP